MSFSSQLFSLPFLSALVPFNILGMRQTLSAGIPNCTRLFAGVPPCTPPSAGVPPCTHTLRRRLALRSNPTTNFWIFHTGTQPSARRRGDLVNTPQASRPAPHSSQASRPAKAILLSKKTLFSKPNHSTSSSSTFK